MIDHAETGIVVESQLLLWSPTPLLCGIKPAANVNRGGVSTALQVLLQMTGNAFVCDRRSGQRSCGAGFGDDLRSDKSQK